MKTNKNSKYNKNRKHTSPRKYLKWIFIGIGIFVFIYLLLVLIQVPYTIQVSYTEREPYQTTEYYQEQVNALNCDYVIDCYCLHHSCLHYGGLFGWGDCDNWACDSCNCRKERTITDYQDVWKTREETRYCNLWKKIVRRC